MSDFEFELPNLDDVERKIADRVKKFDDSALFAVGQVGLALERDVKKLLTNNSHRAVATKTGGRRWIPRGHIGADGTPPNRRTGALLRSVFTDLRKEPGSYVASVFPSMVYAKSLELGNPNWKSGVKYPYLRPAFVALKPRMVGIFERAFAQKMGAN